MIARGRSPLVLVALAGLAGCGDLIDHDDIYSKGADHYVLCAQNIDDKNAIGLDQIRDALSRAKTDGTTLHLYAHVPGETIAVSTIEGTLAAATDLGLKFTTYEELSMTEVPGSLALAFDDNSVDQWIAQRSLFDRYNARVTFFVTRFPTMTDDEHTELRDLANDGHDIEYHTTNHLDAIQYVIDHGLDAWIADEINVGLTAMQAAGYNPTIFAYPFGSRDNLTDDALKPYFSHLRAIRSTCPR